MRAQFSKWVERTALQRSDLIFLTGDLGFHAFEDLAASMQNRFVNMGVAEQNMISVAAGLAHQGLSPICYSIAPFAVFRPAEQIRLDVCIRGLSVKIVGNGGGYGYGIMGPTHHALEDLAVMSAFPKMNCYVPFCEEDVDAASEAMISRSGPAYLRLGIGSFVSSFGVLPPYQPIRRLRSGPDFTAVGIGPVVLNLLKAVEGGRKKGDVFAVSELPLNLPLADGLLEILESIKRTRRLLVVEEAVERGGLAENLSRLLLSCKVGEIEFRHRFAVGYPNQVYGNQDFHQRNSGLDSDSLQSTLGELADA